MNWLTMAHNMKGLVFFFFFYIYYIIYININITVFQTGVIDLPEKKKQPKKEAFAFLETVHLYEGVKNVFV